VRRCAAPVHVSLTLVEDGGPLGRASSEDDQPEHAERDHHPVAAQGEPEECAGPGIPAHARTSSRSGVLTYSLRKGGSNVGGWRVRLWIPCWPRRASTSPTRSVSTVKATREP